MGDDELRLDQAVRYRGRQYYVRGVDPMGASERHVYLQDALTGEAITAPVDAFIHDDEPESASTG